MALFALTPMEGTEDKIVSFVYSLTGLRPVILDSTERFTLKLGNFEPIEIGFDKRKHPDKLDFNYSTHVKLLEIIADMLKSPEGFQIWMNLQNQN